MKVAVVGSRNISIADLSKYLPKETTYIISGGAKGVDQSAKQYAIENDLPLIEFLPEYNRYGRAAPLKRNIQIIENADLVIAFWDGTSRGTKFVIDTCKRRGVIIRVYLVKDSCVIQM